MTTQRRPVRLTPLGKSVVVFFAIFAFIALIFGVDALVTAAFHLPSEIQVSQ